MNRITQEDAIRNARTKLDFKDPIPARVWMVRRLDRLAEAYYLVELGEPNAAVGIATVDSISGEVGVYARLPAVGPHLTVDARLAIEIAAGGKAAQAEIVWMPCSASRSPLYPFWEVRTPNGIKYVDQQRTLHNKLEPATLG